MEWHTSHALMLNTWPSPVLLLAVLGQPYVKTIDYELTQSREVKNLIREEPYRLPREFRLSNRGIALVRDTKVVPDDMSFLNVQS